jgi:GWxTD domain-containing protein
MEKRDTILHPRDLSLVSGSFPIRRLPSGNYLLNVTLENNSRVIVASNTLFFQRLNTHPLRDDTARMAAAAIDTGIENINVLNLNKTFLEKYNTDQIRSILRMLLPVSDPQETQTINGFLKTPEELYMRYYIYNYFQAINKDDPARAWREYADKVKEANRLFSEGRTPGYETERGFIYLRYGAPADVITVEDEAGSLPYEIWQYNTLTQMNHKDITDAVFLFYRPVQMLSGFKLLHSSVAGEIQNPSWRSFLYTNQNGSSTGDSRAEQYIGNK